MRFEPKNGGWWKRAVAKANAGLPANERIPMRALLLQPSERDPREAKHRMLKAVLNAECVKARLNIRVMMAKNGTTTQPKDKA